MFNSLSGRVLVLTVIFVMLAEVMIFVPSVANFREDFYRSHLERAQIASLTLLANDMLDPELEAELLTNAGVYNVVLHRDETRQLVLSSAIPGMVEETYDLRDAGAVTLIVDALQRIANPADEVVRVIGEPVREGGLTIEVTMPTGALRSALIDYGLNILALSLVISVITAGLLFLAMRRLLLTPIQKLVGSMQSYAAAPDDARRIITPSTSATELRQAETALHELQTDLTQSLKQRERLAQLGEAVAKISHDLRNILTTAQLFTDRIELSEDPTVRRLAPKLENSMRRTLYAKTSRNGDKFASDRFLQLFDFPPPRSSIAKRTPTITPQQSLFLLNNQFFKQRASVLAKRLETEATEPSARVELAYRLLFGRQPSDEERVLGVAYLTKEGTSPDRYAQALLASNEFMFVE